MSDVVILILLIVLSGFFAASEMAFVVANKLKIELRARKNNIPAKSAHFFLQNSQHFFSTILIGNNVVNIAFASMSTIFLFRTFGMGDGSILIISTVVILLFGELIPKYFSREIADSVLLTASIPLRIISFVFYPFIKITSSLSSFLTQFSSATEESISSLFNREDIETLVKEGHEAGAVHQSEKDIISRVFDLGEQRVYEA
ncbi:MAG: CNNM domain-containing protein, partial [Ignavibacteriaceae bacterium]|nr:CNNM domain-containing protein [Ignavibacteriaceae bacterium]